MEKKISKRQERMTWLKSTIAGYFTQNNGQPIEKNRIIAAFCMIHNAPERAAKELLNILHNIDYIKINKNHIEKGAAVNAGKH